MCLQVEYACIRNVCIYRRAGSTGSTGSTIYVYMHACMHVLCMYVDYLCTLFGALFGATIGAPGGIDVSQMGYVYYYDCMYVSTRREHWEYYIYVYMHVCMYYVCMYTI